MENKHKKLFHLPPKNFLLVILFSLFTFALLLEYRLSVYFYIKKFFNEFYFLKIQDYLFLSAKYDLSVLIFFTSLFLFLAAIVRSDKVLPYLLASLLFPYFLLSGLASDYFRVYETSFRWNLFSKDIAAGWWEIYISVVSEISPVFYIKIPIFFLLCLGIIKSYNLKNSPHKTLETKNKFHKYFFPAILIILTFAALSVNIDHSLAKITGNITNIPIKKSLASLHDFSVNPLYDLFSSQEIKSPDEKDSSMPTALKSEEKFSQKLNTDSLQNRKRYPFLSPFRRGEKYNIIFYFFESTANKYLNEKIAGRRILATWEKLAQNSISFKKHYTTFPFTANAVFSILTSAYDLPVKGIAINKYPKIHLKTAAEFLRSKGYKTAYMHSGNLDFTGQRAFLKHRFDTLVESRDLKKTSPYKKWLGWGLDDRALIQPVVDFARRNKNNPYFLAVAPINPHHPYIIPDEKYNVAREWIKKASGKDKKWFQYLNTLYFADSVLEEILAKLEQEKLMDHTLLFLIADHGEAFFQHNKNYNHALFVYEENVAVPFLIYNKKLIPKPIDFNGISRHIDILPSLLDILDIKKSPEIEGISLFRAHPEQMALVHTYWGVDDYLGVRDGNWKYILRVNDMFEELYDLSLDPGEKNNLASSMPQINARYKNFVLGARQHKREFYKRIQKN